MSDYYITELDIEKGDFKLIEDHNLNIIYLFVDSQLASELDNYFKNMNFKIIGAHDGKDFCFRSAEPISKVNSWNNKFQLQILFTILKEQFKCIDIKFSFCKYKDVEREMKTNEKMKEILKFYSQFNDKC